MVKGPSGEPGSLTDAVCEPDIENSNENIIYKKKICEKREKKKLKNKKNTHNIDCWIWSPLFHRTWD